MLDEAEEDALARDMIEVHGVEAAGVARANARTGAVASAKLDQVLEVVQRRSAEQASGKHTSGRYTVQEES